MNFFDTISRRFFKPYAFILMAKTALAPGVTECICTGSSGGCGGGCADTDYFCVKDEA